MAAYFASAPKQQPAPPPMPATMPDPEDDARKQRLETIDRNRRGRAGMIATSERGVLAPATGDGKRLLGE